jgi:hypothetical protein
VRAIEVLPEVATEEKRLPAICGVAMTKFGVGELEVEPLPNWPVLL